MLEDTFQMSPDEYKDYIAENGPDVFELLVDRVLFLGKGNKLFSDSGYYYPTILIQRPGAHYENLDDDGGDTFQGGHIELYTPTTRSDDGNFVIFNEQGVDSVYCTESDVIRILNSVI